MKTIVPFKLTVCLATLLISFNLFAQSTQGLIFNSNHLKSGTDLAVHAVYLFSNVTTNVDATVSIDSAVNGASVSKIDDNSGGLGYTNAFQPEINIPSGTGTSYVVFTIRFYVAGTNTAKTLTSIQGTALDIDGNSNLKEFGEINMGGGTATYQTGTIDISVTHSGTKFKGANILGIERNGIDTAALGNMFTVNNSNISSLTVKYGATTNSASAVARQYSLYMKGFNYGTATILPVKLVSFDATLNKNKVDLKWTTASEQNVSHFVVERSLDGTNYSDAGVVFAVGNSSQNVNYNFSDDITSVQSSVIYYRLCSVDNDGKTQYSEVRIIRVSKQADNTITIITYPNPVSNDLRITVPATWQNKKVSFEIFNAAGQLSKKSENGSSSQTETINVSDLSRGMYVVRVSCNGETAQQKIIKN